MRGVRLILGCFEMLSGLKINLSKSALLAVNVEEEVVDDLSGIMGCVRQSFPNQHLGLPLVVSKIRAVDWRPLTERMEKRLEGWAGKRLSWGGRLTLLQTVMANLPIFYMSLFRIPIGIANRMEMLRRRFLRSGADSGVRKVCLIKWNKVRQPKRLGGLGVRSIVQMNKALLGKWVWKSVADPKAMWVKVFSTIYTTPAGSHFPSIERSSSQLFKG
ncbi:hypothetical protein QJS04_geneDACA024624 [Acorus gramineus]|uniref:Uncharacterized protein n=1 Tax=Acorus gramineus TaxID=55184 RepID=A0AAV8ZWL6_ACOGR|nr:hypothetical protein QJS04_geneDACA024624 [Acorus gramineus]